MAGNTVSKIKVGNSNYDIIASNGFYTFSAEDFPNTVTLEDLYHAYVSGLQLMCKIEISGAMASLPLIGFGSDVGFVFATVFGTQTVIAMATSNGIEFLDAELYTDDTEIISTSDINTICGINN